MTVATDPRVELQGLSKRFGNVLAVDSVSLSIAAGTVHALVGANGAGKSTVGKMVAGAISPTDGRILLDGEAVQFGSPREALDQGVAFIAQELGARAGHDGDGERLPGRRAAHGSFVDRG